MKIITFTSGRGGQGKSTLSTNIAITLANNFNKKVLLLDCDMGLTDSEILLGIMPEFSIEDVLFNEPKKH